MCDFNEFIKTYLRQNEFKTIELENGFRIFIKDFSKCRRPNTIIYYKEHFKSFMLYCSQNDIFYFHELSNEFILRYCEMLKYKVSNNTINKRITIIKMVINYLMLNKYISELNLNFPKFETKQKEITCISDSQLNNLINYADSLTLKKKVVIYLLAFTGIRRNELVNILVSNIDFTYQRIYLDFTKSHKARYIYFNDLISNLLKELIKTNKQNVYLFETKHGKRLEPTYITYLFFELKHELNINNLSPHKLRHTYATYLLKHGANQEQVRRLLGHSDFKMTKRYIDYIDTDLKKANFDFGPINLLKHYV